MSPISKKWCVALLTIGTLAACVWLARSWLGDLPFIGGFTKSVNANSYFYRLKASYLHGTEPVDFDIVVGCNVRVTTYGDNSTSYDAFRDPVVFAKRTADAAAVMLMVPDACMGYTTANGQVPADLLPGVVWFDSKDDLSLGIGYVAEDAFENPKSKLKFLGASIEKASLADWEAFRPIAAQNLVDPKIFTHTQDPPSEAEVRANLWNKTKLDKWTRPSVQCFGVARFHIDDNPEVKEILDRLWPKSKPRFWAPRKQDVGTVHDLLIGWEPKARFGGYKPDEYYTGGLPGSGFPTRARGGNIRNAMHYHKLPWEPFPLKADDGVPWARPELGASSATIFRDIELDGGANRGFVYCYAMYRFWGAVGKLHLPSYLDRSFVTRVDGETIATDYSNHLRHNVPQRFFERDEYYYQIVTIGLN